MWYRCCGNIPPRPLDDISQEEGKLKRKYGYVREEKIFRPMKRFRSRKRSELNEVEKREENCFWGRGDGEGELMGREGGAT